ncbi:hypothetical protein [Pectobacterium versatile]|uniref:hypothetical protein n=1 Tax=Pectobacterium versatile TaxID=2488639 RepID=UPI00301681C8
MGIPSISPAYQAERQGRDIGQQCNILSLHRYVGLRITAFSEVCHFSYGDNTRHRCDTRFSVGDSTVFPCSTHSLAPPA